MDKVKRMIKEREFEQGLDNLIESNIEETKLLEKSENENY